MAGRRSHSGVLDVLHRLSEHGLVTRVQLNRGYLFTLNRDHLAAEAVDLLMGLRIKLFESIKSEIADWETIPVHASVYGSTARGDGDTTSDIDLLIVRPDKVAREEQHWQAQVDGLREQIEAWTGNRASVADISKTELTELRRQKRPIISELGTDAVAVFGSDLTTLLEAA